MDFHSLPLQPPPAEPFRPKSLFQGQPGRGHKCRLWSGQRGEEEGGLALTAECVPGTHAPRRSTAMKSIIISFVNEGSGPLVPQSKLPLGTPNSTCLIVLIKRTTASPGSTHFSFSPILNADGRCFGGRKEEDFAIGSLFQSFFFFLLIVFIV